MGKLSASYPLKKGAGDWITRAGDWGDCMR